MFLEHLYSFAFAHQLIAEQVSLKFLTALILEQKQNCNEAQQKLLKHSFPGNIRELKSCVELAVVMCNGKQIEEGDIQLNNNNFSTQTLLAEEKQLAEYEKEIIKHFLTKYDYNIISVAQKLGIGKSTIYRLLKDQPDYFKH